VKEVKKMLIPFLFISLYRSFAFRFGYAEPAARQGFVDILLEDIFSLIFLN